MSRGFKIFISVFFVLIYFGSISFAQDSGKEATVEERAFENDTTEEARTAQGEEKHSAAYDVLGRELTSKEKDEYHNATEEEIKNGLLSREQRLVVVRALIEEGESASASKVLAVWPMSKLQTFTELVQIFDDYKEKYGSVVNGVESELVFNIKDDEQAFKKAAQRAYETVFCVLPENEDMAQLVNYLKDNKIFTYSQMVKKIMDTLTPADKQDMLFKALDKVGRSDLKNNKTFVDKILAQQFNCENLTALLQKITPKNKPASKPPASKQNNKKK